MYEVLELLSSLHYIILTLVPVPVYEVLVNVTVLLKISYGYINNMWVCSVNLR